MRPWRERGQPRRVRCKPSPRSGWRPMWRSRCGRRATGRRPRRGRLRHAPHSAGRRPARDRRRAPQPSVRPPAQARAADTGTEHAVGGRRGQAGSGPRTRHHQIRTAFEGFAERGDAVLRPGQRRRLHRGRDRGHRRALHRLQRRQEGRGTGGVADAPSAHRIGHGHAFHDQGAVADLRAGFAGPAEPTAVGLHVFVDLVAQELHLRVLRRHVATRRPIRRRMGRARGIAGHVRDQPFGARRDRGIQHSRRQAKSGRGPADRRDRHAARGLHHLGRDDETGRGQDRLVARVQHRHQRVEDDLPGPAGHHDVIRAMV